MNTGKVDVLLGLQWGDEGKGKVVDVLTPKYDVIARFQGGPNAGHTLEFEGEKYVLRSIPSGIFQGGKVNIIGNGVVLAPDLFMGEAKDLEKSGHDLKSRLYISKKAHLIMPTHRVLDAAIEASRVADVSEHFAQLHKAEDILMEDTGCLPIAYYNDYWLQSSSLKGIWHSPYGYWYLQYGYIEE